VKEEHEVGSVLHPMGDFGSNDVELSGNWHS
jgi:hypothetical protein